MSGLASTDLRALTGCIGLSLDPCLTGSSGPTVETVPGALRGALGLPISLLGPVTGTTLGCRSVTLDSFSA